MALKRTPSPSYEAIHVYHSLRCNITHAIAWQWDHMREEIVQALRMDGVLVEHISRSTECTVYTRVVMEPHHRFLLLHGFSSKFCSLHRLNTCLDESLEIVRAETASLSCGVSCDCSTCDYHLNGPHTQGLGEWIQSSGNARVHNR